MKWERKGQRKEGEEQRGEAEQEEIDKKGHGVARSGEPDSMPRLATEREAWRGRRRDKSGAKGQGGTKEENERRKEESRVPGGQGVKEREKRDELDSGRDKNHRKYKRAYSHERKKIVLASRAKGL